MGHEADHSVQLVLRIRISAAILPLPCHGIHRQNIIYFFFVCLVYEVSALPFLLNVIVCYDGTTVVCAALFWKMFVGFSKCMWWYISSGIACGFVYEVCNVDV